METEIVANLKSTDGDVFVAKQRFQTLARRSICREHFAFMAGGSMFAFVFSILPVETTVRTVRGS